MTSLWQVITSTGQHEVVDPILETLLSNVTTALVTLQADAEDAGKALADDVWHVIESLLPVPPGIPTPTVLTGVDLTVTAGRLNATGWQVLISLPAALRIDLPTDGGLIQAGVVVGPNDDQHIDPKSPAPVPSALVIASTGGAASLTLRSESGSDVDVALGSVVLSVDPPEVALPFGFGVRIGQMTLGADGLALPDLDVFLPRLPKLPVGALRCPVSFARTAGQLAGVAADLQDIKFTPPWAGAGVQGSIDLHIDRPTGRSLADLLPTMVSLDIPLDQAPIEVPGEAAVNPAASDGGALSLRVTVSTGDEGASLTASVEAAGNERGIITVPATDEMGLLVALVGALGPYLHAPGAPVSPTFAELVGGATVLTQLVDQADAQTTLQAARLTASWQGNGPAPSDLVVTIDYESSFGVKVGLGGISASTKPGGPVRVRNRNVTVDLDGPRLSWASATTTLVSPGDWLISGIPDSLLRVAGVRGGQGSVTLDLDLRVSLELGVVTVDQTTVRVTIGSAGISVGPAGFGIGVNIPGVLNGRGQLAFHDPGFDAALSVALPSLGAAGKAVVSVQGDMVMVGIQVALFTPIPFANSGLGLYGIDGVLAANARRNLAPGADPITRELAWDPLSLGAWSKGDDVFLGFGADIGTVPDLGFALMAHGSILIGLPDPLLRIVVSALLMRGAVGELLGIIVVTDQELTVAVRGSFGIDHLLTVDVPAGATFPFTDLTKWQARLGGDRDNGRGEPVTVHILPDLLDLEAWGFLMAFGDVSTVAGAKLAPPGKQLDGLSLAFGAGVEIHWSAAIFSFDASGSIIAVITHRPPKPGSTDRPWMLAGTATFRGEVDLGPVSVGASADLDALLVPEELVFYGHAKACAKVDLWLFSIEGCVHIDIGSLPTGDVPAPESPLLKVALVDRTGLVVGTAADGAGDGATVWPDAVPVICFSHWVAQAPTYAGTQAPVGDSVPTGNGWVGTKKLEYRFELQSVRVFEVVAGVRTEVGGSLPAAWQLQLSANVYAGTKAPAEARILALDTIDPHLYLQPATQAGAGFPGDPIAFLGGLCTPVPGATRVWFPGELASLPWTGPMRLPAVPPPASPDDLGDAAIKLIDPVANELDSSALLELVASSRGSNPALPFVEARSTPVEIKGETYDKVCWLPGFEFNEKPSVCVVQLQEMAVDGLVFLTTGDGAQVGVDDPLNGPWSRVDSLPWDGLTIEAWASPPGGQFERFQITTAGVRQTGLVTFGATSVAATGRSAANEVARAHTHDTLEAAAATAVPAQLMLKADTTYEVEVALRWSGRSDSGEYSGLSDQDFGPGPRVFRFRTAPKSHRPPPAPLLAGSSLDFPLLLAASALGGTLFDEHVLQEADLQRYIGGFAPSDGTIEHLCGDPAQVTFTVQHLPALCAVYGDQLTLVARRTDAPPGTPPGHVAPQVVPIPPPLPDDPVFVALSDSHLTALDQARALFVDSQAASDSPCRIRRPGGVVQPPLVLDPEATYQLDVAIDSTGAPAGSGVVIASSTFRTSRYQDMAGLLADLGLRLVPPVTALPAIPLPASALGSIGGLAAPGESFGDGFAAALDALGIGGYDAPIAARTSVLWAPSPDGSWSIVGVLLEAPEPVGRAGRFDVGDISIGGHLLSGRHWDARRTRLLAVTGPFAVAADSLLQVSVHDRPPGAPDPGPATYLATIVATPPTLAGVLR